MSNLKKILCKISLVVWMFDSAAVIVFWLLDIPVSHIMVLIPSLVCVTHYAELNWYLNHQGGNK